MRRCIRDCRGWPRGQNEDGKSEAINRKCGQRTACRLSEKSRVHFGHAEASPGEQRVRVRRSFRELGAHTRVAGSAPAWCTHYPDASEYFSGNYRRTLGMVDGFRMTYDIQVINSRGRLSSHCGGQTASVGNLPNERPAWISIPPNEPACLESRSRAVPSWPMGWCWPMIVDRDFSA